MAGGGVATLFICSPSTKLGHRVTRTRKRSSLGWVDPFLGLSRRRVQAHSEADRPLSSFLSSSFARGTFPILRSLAHSPNCQIDHSHSPRGRSSCSSRGSGTADRLTRRFVVRLHMAVLQSLRPSVCSDNFTIRFPLRKGMPTTRRYYPR